MKLNSQINIVLTNEKLEKGFEKLKNLGFKLSHFPLIKTCLLYTSDAADD